MIEESVPRNKINRTRDVSPYSLADSTPLSPIKRDLDSSFMSSTSMMTSKFGVSTQRLDFKEKLYFRKTLPIEILDDILNSTLRKEE